MPPTKPTLPVFDAMMASRPTRNEPSCSLNSTDCTFGSLTTPSMMVKRTLGNSLAIFSTGFAWLKPTPMIGSWPRWAKRRCACSNWVSLVTSNSRIVHLGLGLELLGAVVDPFVERLVELAADVEDDGGLDVGRAGAGDAEDEAGECREQ